MKFNLITKALDKPNDFSIITMLIMEPETDLHGDIATEEEITKASHNYMIKKALNNKLQHAVPTTDFALVETFILEEPKKYGDVEVKKGSWLGKFKIFTDEIKKAISNGIFKGASIGGKAKVTDVINKALDNPHKDKPLRYLSDIEIEEISLVDYPANNKVILNIQKNLDGENTKVPIKIEDIKKAVEEDKELLEQIKKEYSEKPKGPEAPKTVEDIYKSLSPELAIIFKAQQDKVIELEKAQNEVIKKQFDNKVTEIKKYAKVDDELADALMTISKSNPDHYKLIEKALNTTIDTIKKSEFFNPVGADNPEDKTTNTHETKVENIAKRLIKENPKLTKEQAIAKIYKENIEQ